MGLIPKDERNFEVLSSSGHYKGLCMVLQGVTVTIHLCLLPLQGCDTVLGA